MNSFDTRVSAYGVVIDQRQLLLVHFQANGVDTWTLPGGGLELGEDCEAAARREVLEETGYQVVLEELLGVDSVQVPARERLDGSQRHLHGLRVIYRAAVVGGVLTREVDGSSDDARWFPLESVSALNLTRLVEVGIRMWHTGGKLVERDDETAVRW